MPPLVDIVHTLIVPTITWISHQLNQQRKPFLSHNTLQVRSVCVCVIECVHV